MTISLGVIPPRPHFAGFYGYGLLISQLVYWENISNTIDKYVLDETWNCK